MKRLTQKQVLEFIGQIETGAVTLTSDNCIPQEVYAGDVPYLASNGWRVTVFNDCNDWDYFDSIQGDGQVLDYDYFVRFMPSVANYRPSEEVAWERYGIPGYLTFRCLTCGKELTDSDFTHHEQGFRCYEHKPPVPAQSGGGKDEGG